MSVLIISHATTSEIISQLFENNFRGLMQLINIFQHVQCH